MDLDCAYCPLGIVAGAAVMLDDHPAHPECAEACEGLNLPGIRAEVAAYISQPAEKEQD